MVTLSPIAIVVLKDSEEKSPSAITVCGKKNARTRTLPGRGGMPAKSSRKEKSAMTTRETLPSLPGAQSSQPDTLASGGRGTAHPAARAANQSLAGGKAAATPCRAGGQRVRGASLSSLLSLDM